MSKDGLTSDDEEYRFTEVSDTSIDPYGSPKKNANNNGSMLSMVVILVLGLCGYKLYHIYSQKKQDTFAPVQATAETVKAPVKTMPAPPEPEVKKPEPSSASASDVKDLAGKLDASSKKYGTDFQALKDGLKYLHTQDEQTKETINAAEARIQALEQQLSAQEKSLTLLMADRDAAIKRKMARLKPMKVIHYHVTGIMPGRAWLSSSEGSTLTVALGDYVPGYGRITQVDALNGNIMTEKGLITGKEEATPEMDGMISVKENNP